MSAVGFKDIPAPLNVLARAELTPLHRPVHILASGPSIAQTNIDALRDERCLFVNGSISLTQQHEFSQCVGYVVTDARFVSHGQSIIERCYQGQPFFATVPVFQALAQKSPAVFARFQAAFNVIHAADRPWQAHEHKSRPLQRPAPHSIGWLYKALARQRQRVHERHLMRWLSHNPDLLICSAKPLTGVSLTPEAGFIEAGTVAYAAAQIAYWLGASEIHVHGVDLLNASSQPRFYESAADKAPNKLDKAIATRIVPNFDWMAQQYAKRGVQAYNHSPVSRTLFKYFLPS